MAHSPRGWTGARTPSAVKRVRQTERRRLINQPRRSAAKTLVVKSLAAVTNNENAEDVQAIVQRAVAALDRAAKVGAIHKNAAARRKSRLMLKVNAALGGEQMSVSGKSTRTTGKTAAMKQARARIAASKATKAKGAQTAAGKARAALARTSRGASAGADTEAITQTAEVAPSETKSRATAKSTAKSTAKPSSASAAKSRAKKPSVEAESAPKARSSRAAAKPAAASKTRGATKKS